MSPAEILCEKELDAEVQGALSGLNERERLILDMRFGLGNYKPHTLKRVSQKLRISSARVRQIEQIALSKIRRRLNIRIPTRLDESNIRFLKQQMSDKVIEDRRIKADQEFQRILYEKGHDKQMRKRLALEHFYRQNYQGQESLEKWAKTQILLDMIARGEFSPKK